MPFLDIYMPDEVPGYPCVSAPRFKTTIQVNAGGTERRNQEWQHPLHNFILPEAIARESTVSNSVVVELKKHWLIMAGPFYSFPFTDPLDKASIDHIPNEPDADIIARLTDEDQPLGTGDGFTDSFQLKKRYTVGAETYDRDIHLPILSTVIIANNGTLVNPADYTVSRPGGVVTFDTPPANARTLTAGFLFDCEVRFESDDQFEGIVRTWQTGGFADLTLVEVRPC
jgi:uncharacterized protein (TIGR02217 family)